MKRGPRFALQAAATLVLAALAWAVLGYLATAPLGAIFGWSGHPPIPAAPKAVYVGLYLVALPAGCLAASWAVVRLVTALVRRRTDGGAVSPPRPGTSS